MLLRMGRRVFLFEYGNISDLAEKAASLLTDEAQRSRLRDGGLNWASNLTGMLRQRRHWILFTLNLRKNRLYFVVFEKK